MKNLLKNMGYYTDWHLAGIPGGIPKATDMHTTIDASAFGNGKDDAADVINKAIQAAGNAATEENKKVIQLSEGIFKISDTIRMDRSNVVLRGAGIDKTLIRALNDGPGTIVLGCLFSNNKYPVFTSPAVNVVIDVKTGDQCIEVEDASWFKAGNILKLDRLADDNGDPFGASGGKEWLRNGKFFIRDMNNGQNGPASSEGFRPVSQFIEIKEIKDNTLFLTNKINIDFETHLKPQVWNTQGSWYQYIGIEDFKLQTVEAVKRTSNWDYNPPGISLSLASSYCWVKNIESDGKYIDEQGRGFKGQHIRLNGFRNIVTGCYVHDSQDNRPGGNGYGIQFHGTDCLIENNICDKLCKPLQGYASNGGNVIAYNYVPNTETGSFDGPYPVELISWSETAIDASHSAYSHSDLYEGNYAANISTDATQGNNGWIVFFRNHAWGQNLDQTIPQIPSRDNLAACNISGWNNEHASIGNVWLDPVTANLPFGAALWSTPDNINSDKMAVYSIGNMAWHIKNRNEDNGSGFNNWDDGWTFGKFFWKLDFNYAGNKIESKDSNDTVSKDTVSFDTALLPESLYLEKPPDFFIGCIWPPVNPFGASHIERAGTLPAKDRYAKYSEKHG